MNALFFLSGKTRTVPDALFQTLCASGLVGQFEQANTVLDLEAGELSIEDELRQ
jgi:hypothetical protein